MKKYSRQYFTFCITNHKYTSAFMKDFNVLFPYLSKKEGFNDESENICKLKIESGTKKKTLIDLGYFYVPEEQWENFFKGLYMSYKKYRCSGVMHTWGHEENEDYGENWGYIP